MRKIEARSLGAYAVIGIAAGGTGAAIAALFNLGFKSGDVFAFSGALIGAAATVAGAAWLAEWSARAAHRREADQIIAESSPLLTATRVLLPKIPKDLGSWAEFRPQLHELAEAARDVLAVLREALALARTLDFRERVALARAVAAVDSFQDFHSSVFSPEGEHPLDERSWPSEFREVEHRLAVLVAELS